ncbi:MAG: hypothetical protein DI535_14025 [Citrobacter freundii]|nr:MAG: hypothetical protein DI535_14025 [Citrobacter freundii]
MNLHLRLAIIACISCSLLSAQSGLGFRRLGVNEGLSQNSVREIFQDRQGFIWIGTGDGLNRYDGIQIKKYRQSFRDHSSKRFPGKILTGRIHEDAHGNLWMLVDGKLVKMNVATETFEVIREIGRDLEYNIIALLGNTIYVNNAFTVTTVNIVDGSVREIRQPNAFGVYQQGNQPPGILYTKGNSIFSFDHHNSVHTKLLDAGKDSVYSAVRWKSGILYKAGNNICEYDLDKKKVVASYPTPDPRFYSVVVPLLKTKTGDIVLAVVGKGITVINHNTGAFLHYANIENNPFSLSSNLVYTAIIDQSDNMWVGTEGGGISVLNLKPRLFEVFPDIRKTKNESSFLMVKSIYAEGDQIYVGTYGKGLYVIDKTTSAYKILFDPLKKQSPSFSGIFFIKKDDKGRAWMNMGSEVGIADLEQGKFKSSVQIPYKRSGKNHNIPQCFAQVSPSSYLVGTVQSTYLLEEKDGVLSAKDLGAVNATLEGDIQTIFKKDNEEIIIGKGESEGYLVIKLKGDRPEIIKNGLAGLSVKNIYRDKARHAFWFSTNAGIVIQKDNDAGETLIDELDGLSNDFIYAVVPADQNTFWVSTNKGINRLSLENDTIITVRGIEQYTIQHGLQSNEFNTGAYYREDTMIFFGGVTGINWFDLRRFDQRSFAPHSYVTDLLINERPLENDSAVNFLKDIRLNYKENNLLIRFATLEFTNPEVNEYLYRLMGYDKTWIKANNTPEARYSKLPPGNYHFEIISSNSEGVWSAPNTLLSLTITPPFWLTWWFRALAVIAALSVIYLISRYYVNRKVEKQRRTIEQELAVNNERLRISRDMHDELGTGLSKIALLTEVGKTADLPAGNDKIIDEISDTSRKLSDKMGEIIWTLNPQNDTLGNLAAYLKEYIYETTDSLPLTVGTDFPEVIPEISLRHILRQQLLLVTKEAVNNALKHSGASHIEFSLAVHADNISFAVKDNGCGFGTGTLGVHANGKKNGLANMRSRMEEVNGFFFISSTPGSGTEIRYGIPL